MGTRPDRARRITAPPVALSVSMLAEWVQSTYSNVQCDQLRDAMLRAVGVDSTGGLSDPLLDGEDILIALNAGLAVARDPHHPHVEPVVLRAA